MKKYEYKVTGRLSESELNSLGEQGWKMVNSTVSAIPGYHLPEIKLYFRRKLE